MDSMPIKGIPLRGLSQHEAFNDVFTEAFKLIGLENGKHVEHDNDPATVHHEEHVNAPATIHHEEHLPNGISETEAALQEEQFIGTIDQGTTSSRFIIFDAYGTPVASHQIEFENIYPDSG